MQLSKIKIAGFKTFVDPTNILLPSNLVAVVGPNGCGKSNIIDAVTWVMGESSPKYLRGEASTDVIFNGSGTRKPVGQASVELIFDNTDALLGGEYSKYAEISVRRVINRDSESTYYLNGVRCRKRDVVDIFLGTGLGPRSYSIIGQNMINKIIEAKPDELRTYLEEAAGISKYKERRHETELRITHTKENLDRINDVCAELDKQLSHLKHQANMAEKYKTLKQQERLLQAECYALKWRQIDALTSEYSLSIKREETALESHLSELSATDRTLDEIRHKRRNYDENFQEVQKRYYSVGNEITRLEQDILHRKEREQQWRQDLAQTDTDVQSIKQELQNHENNLSNLAESYKKQEPESYVLEKELSHLENELETNEDYMQDWQMRWDSFNHSIAKTKEKSQVEKTNIQHLEERIVFLQKRQDQIAQDLNRMNVVELDNEINSYEQQSLNIAEQLQTHLDHLNSAKQNINQLFTHDNKTKSELNNVRSELQQLRGQQASLNALQQTALGQRDNPNVKWIEKNGLNKNARLAQYVEVEAGWELAVEKVLGFYLQAIEVNALRDNIIDKLKDFNAGKLCAFIKNDAGEVRPKTHKKGVLILEKITSPWLLDPFVNGVYVADDIEEALKLSEVLDNNESVITKDGIWLNRSWIKILREEDPAQGVFQREQALKKLLTRIKQLETNEEELEKKLHEIGEQIKNAEEQREDAQKLYNEVQASSLALSTQQKLHKERIIELKVQRDRLLKDKESGRTSLNQAEVELIQAQKFLQEAIELLGNQENERDELLQEKEAIKQTLHRIRERLENKKDLLQELKILQERSKSQQQSLRQTIAQLQNQLVSFNERKNNLQNELGALQPLESIKEILNAALDKHVGIENELSKARSSLTSLDESYREFEEKRHRIEEDIDQVRSKLENARVEAQGYKVEASNLLEQLKQTEFNLEETLKNLSDEIDIETSQKKLEQIGARINRLGAINLVAIEEYSTCLKRKEYLDKQVADLQAGLATLQDAIHKIDKETKLKFKETFDTVNEQFQILFPKVFGGGKSYLELTSDNLLEAGVSVMACPPGKRNSSIYLLSGGEKSLTAIALIFSIFYLNPAPFCLLDEVDAALDDVNVLRFTHLVKSMTDKTQFVFISHNKITIEMGEHLIGVTMNEPGVSRLVTVDIDNAMDLASAGSVVNA